MATAAARRYARAVFELASEEKRIDEWLEQIQALRVVMTQPDIEAVLVNPTIPNEERMKLIVAGDGLTAEAVNLARLLIESDRVGEIGGVVEEFETLADQAAGRVRATVTTAVALDAQDRDRVGRELSKRLGKDVRMSVVVDPRIVGGLKLQYGDRIVDASIATRLQQLRRRLADAT